MSFNPAMGSEVHRNASGEQGQRDGERAGDPCQLDAAFEHEEVEDAEDQYEDRRLGEERGAAAPGDHDQVEYGRGMLGGEFATPRFFWNKAQAGKVV